MTKAIPTVQKYMTYTPKSIGFDRPLSMAVALMRELQVRHLPVLKGGQLVGVLSDRDINRLLTFEGVDPEKIQVEEAFTADPYFTKPTALLNEVAAHMAQHKYGCAIVMDNHKLVGIFTEVDAYRALSDLLETRLAH